MKILHTSDWHLGRTLYGRRCLSEFSDFLQWLLGVLEQEHIDCLVIAGDIFDSTTPSNGAQRLYYSFLHSVSKTHCRHVIITGGNHDSPSLLNAPRDLLRHINVTVVGSVTDSLEDEVVTLKSDSGDVELIVCAVPYLRDRDVRQAEAGESYEAKAQKLTKGIEQHYRQVIDLALEKKANSPEVPILAMGHLFASGGKIIDNNEIRDLYVGTLAHIHSSSFPQEIDYLALGHLHIAQRVNNDERFRYSGSPLQLSFGKGNSDKTISIVTLNPNLSVKHLAVPAFLHLETITGERASILRSLEGLQSKSSPILVEIIYTGSNIVSLVDELEKVCENTPIELIRVVHRQSLKNALTPQSPGEALEEMDEVEVFRRCMSANNVHDDEIEALEHCFREILQAVNQDNPEGDQS